MDMFEQAGVIAEQSGYLIMAEVSVNSVKASEVSKEMVALYLLASVAAKERAAAVSLRDGVPLISGLSKEWLLTNYVDCLQSVLRREAQV
jgi:hypothetical protein